jgi:hypothetical protein
VVYVGVGAQPGNDGTEGKEGENANGILGAAAWYAGVAGREKVEFPRKGFGAEWAGGKPAKDGVEVGGKLDCVAGGTPIPSNGEESDMGAALTVVKPVERIPWGNRSAKLGMATGGSGALGSEIAGETTSGGASNVSG